jgi:DNA helicase INO80
MTKMLDLLEDYLLTQHLSYFRMDGSTQLQDRRFMVDEYQKNPNIFAFLLSTRAGGLGINLIAADTVIFYDNDWNPTMDEQATDRAHRIGQTKPVTIYRLVTRGTVEEKIVRRAQQKQNVQSTVYGDQFKVKDVQMMLADDDEQDFRDLKDLDSKPTGFIKQGRQRGPRGKKTAEKASKEKNGKP